MGFAMCDPALCQSSKLPLATCMPTSKSRAAARQPRSRRLRPTTAFRSEPVDPIPRLDSSGAGTARVGSLALGARGQLDERRRSAARHTRPGRRRFGSRLRSRRRWLGVRCFAGATGVASRGALRALGRRGKRGRIAFVVGLARTHEGAFPWCSASRTRFTCPSGSI